MAFNGLPSKLLQIYFIIVSSTETWQSVGNQNTKGRAFMLSFFKNFGGNGQNSIIITTEFKTLIFVNVPSTASVTRHYMRANSSIHLQLPFQTTITSWGISERKAVSVYSTEPVSVYGINSRERSTGAYLAIPLDKWSYHYTVATYNGDSNNGGEIVIISAEDNTSVKIWLNVIKLTTCNARTYTVDSKTVLTYVMNKEEVLRIACDDDLTGSVVEGSKPIGVISGNVCIRIPASVPYCDHLVEMMVPTTSLGCDYLVAPLAGKETFCRVIYTDNSGSTNLTITHMGPDVTVTRDNRLFHEFTISPATVVRLNTSKPVLVVLYTTGSYDYTAFGDPSMTIVVPIERFDSDYNVDFNWGSLIDASHLYFYLDVYSPGNVASSSTPEVDLISSVNVFGFTVSNAAVTNGSYLSKSYFTPNSNVIASVSSNGTSAVFPVGMKLEFFTGVNNCTDNPCLNQGICYTHGHRLLCYCGDQLAGDRCEKDIFNACASFPCQNNASCIDLPIMFKCICSRSFTGKFCESEVKNEMATTTEPYKKIIRETEMCTCTCENVTSEVIKDQKEKIKKELTVDVKELSKNKNRYTTIYDSRSSATGIGIIGVLFLALVTGSILMLDMITAVAYIVSYFEDRKHKHKLEKSTETLNTCFQVSNFNNIYRHHDSPTLSDVSYPTNVSETTSSNSYEEPEFSAAPWSNVSSVSLQSSFDSCVPKPAPGTINPWNHSQAPSNLGQNPAESYSEPSACTRSVISLPRFQIDSNKVLVVGKDGGTFKIRRCSWSFKKELVTQPQDSMTHEDSKLEK